MSEIIKLSKDIKLTSRQIAEATGKRHDHVIVDVETLIKFYEEKYTPEKSGLLVKLSEYKASNGKMNKMYILNRDAITDLITGYSLEHRHNVNQLMYAQEEEIKRLQSQQKPVLPQNYEEALEHLLIQVKENRLLKDKIEQDAPKVALAEALLESDSGIRITDFARASSDTYGLGRNKMYAKLREWEVLDDNNHPYQRCINAGWFYTVERPFTNGDFSGINIQVFVTGKGQKYIINRLIKENIVGEEHGIK